MSIASHLPKSKKPKQLSPSVARADTPLYGVELAATDLKSLRELPADANVSGTTPIGNGLHGILITSEGPSSGPAGNRIEGNTIAFNGGDGVFSSVGCCNQIKSNSIFSNGGLGIDLGPDGVTPNDPGDADSGPNDLQNFPVPSSATSSDNGTTIQGTLDSTPSTQFELEFFSAEALEVLNS